MKLLNLLKKCKTSCVLNRLAVRDIRLLFLANELSPCMKVTQGWLMLTILQFFKSNIFHCDITI